MFRRGPRFASHFAALFLLSASALAQTTIHVPTDQPTIQAGIDAANNGDTVVVSPGLYNENIDLLGKAITVTSGATSYSEAGATIINAASSGPVVRFATNETAATVFNRFTVQGGYSPNVNGAINAGIWIHGSSPLLTNNVVRRNIACGILVDGVASPTIASNNIRDNRAPVIGEQSLSSYCGANANSGTGLAINYADTVTVTGNVIEGNTLNGGYSNCTLLIRP